MYAVKDKFQISGLSALTHIIFNMQLTHLGSGASKYNALLFIIQIIKSGNNNVYSYLKFFFHLTRILKRQNKLNVLIYNH